MIFSFDWIRQYVPGEVGIEEAAELLTAAGLAVEGIESRGDDFLLDLDVTTNRPDCMCHLGVARELAVLLERPLNRPDVSMSRASKSVEEVAQVRIDDSVGCGRFVAIVVEGVAIGPSPSWLVQRLESIGQRSINNVVDITNFVLWELGQPIHAYDLDRLFEHRIVVRRAGDGQSFTTLDGQERKLDSGMLAIADGKETVGLAGLMGGLDSEVSDSTTNLLIESAHFDPSLVRHAGKVLGLHTDASHRFERGADPGGCLFAAERVAALVSELAGGRVLESAIDVRNKELDFSLRGRLEMDRLNRFAGVEFDPKQVQQWFVGLGFELEAAGQAGWDVEVPTWRYYDFVPDPTAKLGEPQGQVFEADLFEEAMRILGFEKIPSSLPGLSGPDEGSSEGHERRERIRQHLAGAGFTEAITYAFHDADSEANWPALQAVGEPVRLANPLSELYSVMRRSVIPGLVAAAEFNQRRAASAIRLFEIGHVFPGRESDELDAVALVAGGAAGTDWDRKQSFDLFDLKGAVEALCRRFGLEVTARPVTLDSFVAGTASELVVGETGERTVGFMGQLEGDRAYPLFAAEIRAGELTATSVHAVSLPSRHPGIEVDLTLTHSLDTSWAEIDRALAELRPGELRAWGLKDRYSGKGVPSGAVNTTIFFLYNAEDRSLTQDEVNRQHQELAGELETRFGWGGGS